MPHAIEPSKERRLCCLLMAAGLMAGAMPPALASQAPAEAPQELVAFTENLPPLNYAEAGEASSSAPRPGGSAPRGAAPAPSAAQP